MLLQHRIGMNIARKDSNNAMYIAFAMADGYGDAFTE